MQPKTSPRAAVSASKPTNINALAIPGPSSSNTARTKLKFDVLQFNYNGIRRKLIEITDYISHHRIPIACIQETKLTSRTTLTSSSSIIFYAWTGLEILVVYVNYRLLVLPIVQDDDLGVLGDRGELW